MAIPTKILNLGSRNMKSDKSTNRGTEMLMNLKRDIRLILVNYWKQISITCITVSIIFTFGFSMGRITSSDSLITKNYYNYDREEQYGPLLPLGKTALGLDIPTIAGIPSIPLVPIVIPELKIEVPKEKVKSKVKVHKNITGFKNKYIIQPKVFDAGQEPHNLYLDGLITKVELNEQARCLALNIYFESRSEPLIGKYAVGLVTLGRVEHKNYPNTICGVVWQKGYVKKTKRWVAQFSWTLDGRSDRPKNMREWKEAQAIAIYIYHNYPDLDLKALGLPDDLLHATHYHARYVKPRWRHDFKKVAQIGLHLFYR